MLTSKISCNSINEQQLKCFTRPSIRISNKQIKTVKIERCLPADCAAISLQIAFSDAQTVYWLHIFKMYTVRMGVHECVGVYVYVRGLFYSPAAKFLHK